MFKFSLAVLLVCPAFAADSIQFKTIEPSVIEQRMGKIQKSNSERADALRAMFKEAGCSGGHIADQAVKAGKLPNIVCTLPGGADNVIVVGAHYDKAEHGEGAVDDWSGAALLPSLYESLASQPRKATFIFVGFSNEERAGSGSAAYVKESAELGKVRAMVNLFSLGMSPTKVATAHSDKTLVDALSRIAATLKIPLSGMDLSKDSDATPFQKKKVHVIDLHSITQETFAVPGSENDKMSAVKMDDYKSSYRLVAAYLAFLDVLLGGPAPAAAGAAH